MSYIMFKEYYQDFETAIRNAETKSNKLLKFAPLYEKLTTNNTDEVQKRTPLYNTTKTELDNIKSDIKRLQLLSDMISQAVDRCIQLSVDDFELMQKYKQ